MKILVVEDDDRISDAVEEYLSDQHYAVEVATDGQEAWELLDVFNYDLILLDVMLPRLDGVSLCQRLRSKGCETPILMLTGKDTLGEKVEGLDAGADDYLVKPFELEELSARIRALSRRSLEPKPPILNYGKLQLDPSISEVTYDGKVITLTPKEYMILGLFLRNPKQVFT
jgi:DNA-binding response OmpR family regulator